MGFYLFAFFLLLLGTVVAGNNNILCKSNVAITRFTGLLFILFTGLRAATVGNDTSKYIQLFASISNYDASVFLSRYEPGFVYFSKFLSNITSNPQIIIFISSLVIWASVTYFFGHNSDNPEMSFFIILANGLGAFFMSGIREGIAIALCLVAFEFIKKRKLIFFVLFTLLGSLFHASALLFLIAYPVYWMHFTKKIKTIIIVASFIALTSLKKIISIVLSFFPRYSMYLESEYNNGEIRVASIIILFITVCIYFIGAYFYKYQEENSNNNGMLNLTFIGAMILLISLNFNLLDRVGNYFTIFIPVVIPNVLCSKYNQNRRIIAAVAIVGFLLYFITFQVFKPEWNSICPYRFYWS